MNRPTAGEAPRKPVKLPETVSGFPEFSPQEVKKEPNPFTDPDWRMLTYAWSGFALRVLLVLGGVFSVYQYLQAREEKRVERTLQLVEVWERSDYQAAQRALRRRLAALNEQHAALLGANPSRSENEIYRNRIGIEAMKESGGDMPLAEFRDQFDRIVYFLNRVAFCVEEGLCSRTVADAYFVDYARSFWDYFADYAAQQRRAGSANFARPIEVYVVRRRSGEADAR